MESAKKIIESIESRFPKAIHTTIANCSDLDIEPQQVYQYIIGVTAYDKYGGTGIDNYRNMMKDKLTEGFPYFECSPWPFYSHEIKEALLVLEELGGHFQINLNVDKMVKQLNIKQSGEERYYIVITIVPIGLIYIG